jgi:alpha-tubulin suppressor-like RCC1 family protein
MKPVDVSGLSSGVIAISAGSRHTCALTSAGGVECWGYNRSGELGNGTTGGSETCRHCSPTPVAVSGLAGGVTAISATEAGACALTTAGGVKCWGANAFGELGNGTSSGPETCEEINPCSDTPVDVSGLSSGVVAISGTCALTSAGAVKCWGSNAFGQLGDGSATGPEECYFTHQQCSTTPVEVDGLDSGVAAISSSFFDSCALTSAGAAKCWGSNVGGALGNGTSTGPEECQKGVCSTIPLEVSGLGGGVTEISVGDRDSCALTGTGAVNCWGTNPYGEIGDGTTTGKTTPVEVSDLSSGVMAVSTSGYSSCAVTSAGGVKCWGRNNVGQLGANTVQKCINRTPCSTIPVHANGLAATCTSNSGKVTLEPGLSGTPAVQTMKIVGTLTGCVGEPFITVKYSAALKTAGPVSCSVLKEAGEPASGAAKYNWTPKVKGSLGSLNLSLTDTPATPFVGETASSFYSPLTLSGTATETYKGAAKCGPETVKKGTFSGSAVTFE